MNLRSTLLNLPIQEKYRESQLEDSDSYPSQLINSDLLISVIIPVYNEENSIKDVIERIPNHHNYEIIIVDDGSTDNSLEKVKLIRNRHIKVIKHKNNKGYGAAILTGIRSATGDIIVTMDSDGQHCPEEIPKLIHPIMNNQADMIIGSRYLGQCNYKIPLHTRVGEYFIGFFLWLLFGKNVKNNQSGFRAFNKRSLEVFNDLTYNKFGLCTEMLFKASLNKLKIKEIPITLNPRKYGTSYVNLIKIMFTIISCIIIYSLKRFKLLKFIPRIIIRKKNISLTDEIKYYKKIYEKELNHEKICFSCPTTLLRRPIVDIASRLNNENMCVFFPRDIIKGPNKIHLNKLKNIKINMYPTINLPITSMELPVPISPFFLKRFIKLLKQYDIIHIWVPFYISSVIIIFLKRIHILKKKIFLTMDTFPGLSFNTGKKMNLLFRTFYNSFGKIIFSTVDKVILYGQSMKKFANLVGISNKKIEVIPTGVDLKILQKDGDIRKEFNIDKDEKIILFVGVINVRKGIGKIIEIADKLRDEKLKFILVGDSSKRKYYEKLVKLKKLDHMIIFTGFRRDVHNFYHAADLFLLPSKGEGLPGVLMECMLYGVAIVASDIPGVRDLIINNYNGYLCKNQDMDGFLNKIKILLTNNTKKRLFIENSKMYLTEKFDWNDKIPLYNELCKF